MSTNTDSINVSSESLRSDFESGIRGKSYMESPEVQKIVDQVVKEENIEIEPAQLGCLIVYPYISKTRAAQIKRVNAETEFYSGFQYILKISGEAWDMLDDETRKILVHHELLRIDSQYNEKKGEWKFKLQPPEYIDFYTINERYGSEGLKTIQATVSSLYDLDPRQESKVKV